MAGRKKCAPVKTTEARENQIANLALDLAEEQIRNGTAASSVIVHFLKLITTREKLENDKLRSDLKVAEAKIKQIEDQKDIKDLYEKALAAMKSYAGFGDDGDSYDDYEEDVHGFN